MALTTLEKNMISRSFQTAKLLLDQVKKEVDALDVLYNSQPGGGEYTIGQEGLDEVPSFSGLTKAELDDGMYALTAGIKSTLDNAFAQLEQLAARA